MPVSTSTSTNGPGDNGRGGGTTAYGGSGGTKVDAKSLSNDMKALDTISWSRNGFIAYSIPSLTMRDNLYLTYLENVDGRSWQLARPQRFAVKPSVDGHSPELLAVSWSNLSTDLAVCDVYGNFYILLGGVATASGASSGTTSSTNGPGSVSGANSANGSISSANGPGSSANGSANGSGTSTASGTGASGGTGYELTSYNHLEMIYRDIINNQLDQRPNKSAQFVASKWLPIEKSQILNKYAKVVALDPGASASGPDTNGGESSTTTGPVNGSSSGSSGSSFAYSYGVFQYNPANLCHPIATKQAIIALRSNGELILYYQGEHKVEYHKTSTHLNLGFNYNLNIESASFGFPQQKKIFLVTYDTLSAKVRTYWVEINWGFLVDSANKQKVDPHYNTPKEMQKRPVVSCELVHEMNPMVENGFMDRPMDRLLGRDMDTEDLALGPAPLDLALLKQDPDLMDLDLDDPMDLDMDPAAGTAAGTNGTNGQSGQESNGNGPRETDSDSIGPKGPQESYSPRQRLGHLVSINNWSPMNNDDPLEVIFGYEYSDESLKTSTTYLRYQLVPNSSLISLAFSDIGAKKGVSDEPHTPESSLLFQDKITVPQKVISLSLGACNLEAICEDGLMVTIYNSPRKFVAVGKDGYKVPELIRNLYGTGFHIPQLKITGQNPIIVARSPLGTSVIYTEVNEDTDLNLKLVFARKENYTNISPEELYITSVGLAFHHAYACYLNTCSDDLLVLIQLEVERVAQLISKVIPDPHQQLKATDSFIESIICESHKAINFQLDMFSRESVDKLLSNPPLQKLLSLQLILGDLDGRVNKVSRNIAWIILNLRSTSFGIMFLLSSIYRQISKKKPAEDTLQDSITRAESIISLTGNVRWLVELLIYLNQEMLQLYISRKDPANSKVTFQNSIVLPILLSKVPRLFLMYALSSIGKTHEVLKKLNDDLSKGNKLFAPMKDAFNRYFTACSNSPLNLNLYENFIRDCDNYITKEMNDLGTKTSKGNILRLEQKLVCHGKVSEEVMKYGQWVIAKHSLLITKDLKVAEKFYYELDWIDIGWMRPRTRPASGTEGTTGTSPGPSWEIFGPGKEISGPFGPTGSGTGTRPTASSQFQYSRAMTPRHYYKQGEYIDALRKVLINPKTNDLGLRKCTRCRSLSLINDPLVFSGTGVGLWTMVFQRTCVCGSAWVNIG